MRGESQRKRRNKSAPVNGRFLIRVKHRGSCLNLKSEIFLYTTKSIFVCNTARLSARMQEANWNERKTCVAVTVQTYRLSPTVLSRFVFLFLSFSLVRYLIHLCDMFARMHIADIRIIVTDLHNWKKLENFGKRNRQELLYEYFKHTLIMLEQKVTTKNQMIRRI